MRNDCGAYFFYLCLKIHKKSSPLHPQYPSDMFSSYAASSLCTSDVSPSLLSALFIRRSWLLRLRSRVHCNSRCPRAGNPTLPLPPTPSHSCLLYWLVVLVHSQNYTHSLTLAQLRRACALASKYIFSRYST